MTIEYLPVGIACNLSCTYCYQDPMRDAGNINSARDWPRARAVLESYNSSFAVFGGEPLLAPIEHLEEVWKFGFERFGKNGVQTNGILITAAHIELFKKYNVQVGISIDGPGPLNSLRCSKAQTNAAIEAIRQLCIAEIPPSLIVTMHQENAPSGRLQILMSWLDDLEAWGVNHVNFHMLEVEKCKEGLDSGCENQAFLTLYNWSKMSKMSSEPFGDIRKLLTESAPHVSCIWNGCDPATTAAVQGVNPDGSKSNCGRTNKEGINWLKADSAGHERYLILHQTPQSVGGCKDCTYFIFCKGNCPGTAIDGDWRNRTIHCVTWWLLFSAVEKDLELEGKVPISRNIILKAELERMYLNRWRGGQHHGDSPHLDAHLDTNQKYEGGVQGVIVNGPPKFLTS